MNQAAKRHVILTSGRSGSNYLANTLNLHPQVVNYGEVLGSWTLPWKLFKPLRILGLGVLSYLEYIYSSHVFFMAAQMYSSFSHLRKRKPIKCKYRRHIKHIGVKDFFINFESRAAFDFILNQPEIDVIYLSRCNILRRYLSVLHMAKSNTAVSESSHPKVHQVKVDIKHMLQTLMILEQEVMKEEAMLKRIEKAGHRLMRINYEDYFKSTATIELINKKVFQFLGVEGIALLSKHRKILPNSFSDIIVNDQEVMSALKGTVYEVYLHEN